MSRLASAAVDVKPILVIMGQKGTGKSWLANKLFSLTPPFKNSESTTHVTLEQTFREAPGDEYFAGVVDMRGLDSETNNFLAMHDLYDKPLVFILLNCDPRVKTTVDNITHRLEIKSTDIWVFNAHYCNIQPTMIPNIAWHQYHEIFEMKSQLGVKKIVKSRPVAQLDQNNAAAPRGGVAPGTHGTSVPLSKSAKKQVKRNQLQQKFPLCHQIFGRSISFDTNLSLEQIKGRFYNLSRDQKENNCVEGDALLKLAMARLVTAKVFKKGEAEGFQTNEHLKKFLTEFLDDQKQFAQAAKTAGESGESTDPSVELYGDMFEAVLHMTFSAFLIEELVKFSVKEAALVT